MKKLLIAVCLTCVLAGAAQAAEGETKKKPSVEQKTLRKELIEKYDTNKNGRLDKEERSKMTAEDQEKWNSISPAPKKKAGEAEKE